MSQFRETILKLVQNSNVTPVLLDASLKGFVVLVIAGAVCLLWRRASASARYLIWFLGIVSLPLFPLFSGLLPAWQKPLWSVSTSFNSGNQVSLALEYGPARSRSLSPNPSNRSPGVADLPPGNNAPGSNRHVAVRLSANWLLLAFAAWCCGALLVLISTIAGRFWVGKLSRGAHTLNDEHWRRLLDEARQELGMRHPARLLLAGERLMPLTWGWWRPVILLPSDAGQWPEERRRVVLLHELAHVKRRDCLTHFLTRIVCALFWFNPLVWIASRRMCVERERAADDLVLIAGCKASNYAQHLLEIAQSFRRVPQVAEIAMARASGLEQRVAAIVDHSRIRQLKRLTIWSFAIISGALILCLGGLSAESSSTAAGSDPALLQQQIDQLNVFSLAKEKQAKMFAEADGEEIGSDYQRLFDAAERGDINAVTNSYEDFKRRHGQYGKGTAQQAQSLPHTDFWSPVLEVCLAYDHIANCDPKYTEIAVQGIINSIPRGSIYFGGTDPGRGLPTAFSKSQIDADPFYTLTQNALADGTYLEYLRKTYGKRSKLLSQFTIARHSDSDMEALETKLHFAERERNSLQLSMSSDGQVLKDAEARVDDLQQKIGELAKGIWSRLETGADSQVTGFNKETIYIPGAEDSQKCFEAYIKDATERLHKHQLKPGEDVKEDSNGRIAVSGKVAVMSINGLLAKIIFDQNPGHEFYIEESFPLDWMYPHLEPHGLIMKINRQPLSELPEEVVHRDHDYWRDLAKGMIGDWLNDDTPLSQVAGFVDAVQLKEDYNGFTGDRRFVENDYARRMFSKLRSSIAGVYAWRVDHAKDAVEKKRMIRAADFAFRQAWALCPYSPEVVSRYGGFLKEQGRAADAELVRITAAKFPGFAK